MNTAETWNPNDYDPDVREKQELESDERWQTTNNQLLHAWRAWPEVLERYAQAHEARTGRTMGRDHKAHLTQRFRETLKAQHGTADVDPRWEQMRNDRLRARGMIP